MKISLSDRVIYRLTQYHTIVRDYAKKNLNQITSSVISKLLHIDETQVRKDLKSIGCKGRCNFGYDVIELENKIEDVLDYKTIKRAFVIGAGNLGVALSKYSKFSEFGLEITALFDNDVNKINTYVDDKKIYPLEELAEQVKKNNIEIAILTIPNKVAQDVAQYAIKSGIKYIWNFAPTILTTPDYVKVWHENLAGSFLQFCAIENIC